MIHFSALAFLSVHKSHEFMKLRLSNLIIMAEPTERRSNRPRKPKVHFDDQIAQPSRPSKSSRAPKALAKPTKSTAKPTAKPLKPPVLDIAVGSGQGYPRGVLTHPSRVTGWVYSPLTHPKTLPG